MPDHPHLAVYLCEHVFERSRPILYVSRDGGDWQFLCGGEHADEAQPRVVGIRHIFEMDPSLRSVADLPAEWEAERASFDGPWTRTGPAAREGR